MSNFIDCTCTTCSVLRQEWDNSKVTLKAWEQENQQLKIKANTWRELHRVATDEIKRLNTQIEQQKVCYDKLQGRYDRVKEKVRQMWYGWEL